VKSYAEKKYNKVMPESSFTVEWRYKKSVAGAIIEKVQHFIPSECWKKGPLADGIKETDIRHD
jgi:hypothetical protein